MILKGVNRQHGKEGKAKAYKDYLGVAGLIIKGKYDIPLVN